MREVVEQDALYEIGRTVELDRKPVTKAKGGKSNHNFGIAWDIGIFDATGRYLDGKNKGDNAVYKDFASFIKGRVQGIEWGGDWKSFVDLPHYQLETGKSADEIRRRFEAGQTLLV